MQILIRWWQGSRRAEFRTLYGSGNVEKHGETMLRERAWLPCPGACNNLPKVEQAAVEALAQAFAESCTGNKQRTSGSVVTYSDNMITIDLGEVIS